MERKIGEIFEYEGEWYQCVEPPKNVIGNLCKRCNLRCILIKRYKVPECRADFRSDGKYVIYKKLEPVGDPYPLYGHIVQRYIGVTDPVVLPKEPFVCCNVLNNTIDIEVKQQNPNTEDMEANEKTMPVPDGWEFDRIDESGNIVLKEKKKELPNTWLKCLKCVNDLELIDTGNNIEKWNFTTLDGNGYIFGEAEHHLLPRGLAGPMLALCQLLVCRNAWWQQLGWKPDWRSPEEKYCIYHSSDGVDWKNYTYDCRILAFPTAEVRDQFLETFKDLIEEAKELL